MRRQGYWTERVDVREHGIAFWLPLLLLAGLLAGHVLGGLD